MNELVYLGVDVEAVKSRKRVYLQEVGGIKGEKDT